MEVEVVGLEDSSLGSLQNIRSHATQGAFAPSKEA